MDNVHWQFVLSYLRIKDILCLLKCAKFVKMLLDSPIVWQVMYLEDVENMIKYTSKLNKYIVKYTKKMYAPYYELNQDLWLNKITKYCAILPECIFVLEEAEINNMYKTDNEYWRDELTTKNVSVRKMYIPYDKRYISHVKLLDCILKSTWIIDKLVIKITGFDWDIYAFLSKNKHKGLIKKITLDLTAIINFECINFKTINNLGFIDKVIFDCNINLKYMTNIKKIYTRYVQCKGKLIPEEIQEIRITQLEPWFEAKMLNNGFVYMGPTMTHFVYKRQAEYCKK